MTRAQVLAHRCRAQGLDRRAPGAADLDVWGLGLQDSSAGSAALSLAARLEGGAAAVPDLGDDARWVSVWATRGAPVVLRAGDVEAFAAALWPGDAADAVARLAGNGQQLRKAGVDPLGALAETAAAIAAAVRSPTPKGEVSAAVTRALPEAYSPWCRGCGTHHVGEQLMRLAALPAGTRLVVGAAKATLAPLDGWPGAPAEQVGAERLVRAYLHLLGPAGKAEVAGFLGTSQRAIEASWPAGEVVDVRIDGRRAALLEADVDALRTALAPDLVRLLPRGDPWMLARDRSLTVPDPARHKALWPVLGAPGAVLADGEVVGTWRTRASGRRLTLAVEPFGPLGRRVRDALEEEAGHVGRLRGAASVDVVFADPP